MKSEGKKIEYQTIYSYEELKEIFPFGKTKLGELCRSGILPVVKIGRTYISSPELIEEWFKENAGRELL